MEERQKSHSYEAFNPSSKVYNTPFKRALRKYGFEGFDLKILHDNVGIEEAKELEKKYIKEYKTYYKYQNSNGYNATIGGEFCAQPTDRVVQIDKDFNIVEIFDSVTHAQSVYGRGIREHCKNLQQMGSPFGYFWFYESDFLKMSHEELVHYIRLHRLDACTVQFDLQGNVIKFWDSMTEASRELGLSQGNIYSVCTHERCSCGGFVFMYYEEYTRHGFAVKTNNRDRSKKVKQFSKEGELIAEFDSMTQAAKETGTLISSISRVCKGIRETANGYVWRIG